MKIHWILGAFLIATGAASAQSLTALGAKADGTDQKSTINGILALATEPVTVDAGKVFVVSGLTAGVAGTRLIFEPGAWIKCKAATDCIGLNITAPGVSVFCAPGSGFDGDRGGNPVNSTTGIQALGPTAASPTVEGCTLKNFANQGNAIRFEGVQTPTIVGVSASNTGGDCFHLSSIGAATQTANARIEDNICDRSMETQFQAHAIQLIFKGDPATYLRQPIIRNNHAFASTTFVDATNPVFVVNGAKDAIFEGNTCSGGWYCFSLGNLDNSAILGNAASNFRKAGMEVGNGYNQSVDGLLCDNGVATSVSNTQTCLIADGHSDHLMVRGVKALNMAGACIIVTTNAGTVSGWSIAANVLTVVMSTNNDVQAGTHVRLSGLVAGAFLNNALLTVLTTNGNAANKFNGTRFTAAFAHGPAAATEAGAFTPIDYGLTIADTYCKSKRPGYAIRLTDVIGFSLGGANLFDGELGAKAAIQLNDSYNGVITGWAVSKSPAFVEINRSYSETIDNLEINANVLVNVGKPILTTLSVGAGLGNSIRLNNAAWVH